MVPVLHNTVVQPHMTEVKAAAFVIMSMCWMVLYLFSLQVTTLSTGTLISMAL